MLSAATNGGWDPEGENIFLRKLAKVVAGHVIVLAVLLLSPLFAKLVRPKEDEILPVAIVVDDGGAGEDATPEPEAVEPEPEPVKAPPVPEVKRPDPIPLIEKPVKPIEKKPVEKPVVKPVEKPPQKPPEKRKIEVSRRKVVRTVSGAKSSTVKTGVNPSTIQGAIRGAVNMPGVSAANASEDQIGMSLVRAAVYSVWNPPSREDARGRTVKIRLMFDLQGNIVAKTLVTPSGIPALDQSARECMALLRQVPGLPRGFLQRDRDMVVELDVEEALNGG